MYASAFQLNKTRRAINTLGNWFVFKREGENEFGEPNDVVISTVSCKGLYHETTSYLQKNATDGSTTRRKPSPMILCLWESAELLQHKDTLTYNDKKYTIGEIKNLAEANIIADISLEEVQVG